MKKIYVFLAAIALVSSGLYTYAEQTKSNIASSVLRLHVVANSDSEKDQALKLKVRDAVLDKFSQIAQNTESKNEAMTLAEESKEEIVKAAESIVLREGYDYPVTVSVGKTDFPTKFYKNIALPKGRYDAVNVKIGSGGGKNWWCVMYPPLCVADPLSLTAPEESLKVLSDSLGEENYKIITDSEDKKIKIKFKILELF